MNQNTFVRVALVAVMIAGAAWAQQPTYQPPGGQPSGQPQPMGRPQQPGMTQGQGAMQMTPPSAWYKFNDLIGKTVKDASGADLGKIDELILFVNTGHIPFAIIPGHKVDKSGEQIALPWSVLRFEPGAHDVALTVTKDKIHDAQVATFKKDQWPNLADPTFVQRVYQQFGQTPPADEMMRLAGQREGLAETNWYKVSSLKDEDVKDATGADLGKLHTTVIDLNNGHILFAVLPGRAIDKSSSDVVPVPWTALKLQGSGDKTHLVLNMPKDRLHSAPTFSDDNWSNVTDADFLQRVFAFYNVTPYWLAGAQQVGYTEEQQKPQRPPEEPAQP